MNLRVLLTLAVAHIPVLGQTESPISRIQTTPSYFVSNQATAKSGSRLIDNDDVVAFAQTPMGRVLFTGEGAFMYIPNQVGAPNSAQNAAKTLNHNHQIGTVLRMGFNETLQPKLSQPVETHLNFLRGPASDWQIDVDAYEALVYEDIWPGISITYRSSMSQLGLEMEILPGAKVQDIRLETGARDIWSGRDGALEIQLNDAQMTLGKPHAYQIINGTKQVVSANYLILDDGAIGIECDSYNASFPLIVDPQLSWSTFLGGPGGDLEESVEALAIDGSGHIFVTGSTPSADFPTTPGALDASWNGGYYDIFVCKLAFDGSSLGYATYLGGTHNDLAYGLAVDATGHVYVVGATGSTDFPTTPGAYDTTNDSFGDAFLCKINPTGTALDFSTLLGGTSTEFATDLVLETTGNILVTGQTYSSDYPTTPSAYDVTHNGGYDVFVSRINNTGSDLLQSTLVGGAASEYTTGLAQDVAGNVYVGGFTTSTDFPATVGSLQVSFAGYQDGFVLKLNASLSSLIYGTFLGGSDEEWLNGLAVDTSGQVFVTGESLSSDFPVTPGAYDTSHNGNEDVFVAKINALGSALIYATWIGGFSFDLATGLALDAGGNAYVTGETYSSDFPSTMGAYDQTINGQGDGFIVKLNDDGSTLIYGSFLGGPDEDRSACIALGPSGNPTISGSCRVGFPSTPGAYDTSHNGATDGFITQFSTDGSSLIFSTFLGGSGGESGVAVDLDSSGNVYITGTTSSAGFPTTVGAFSTAFSGDKDVFVAKMPASGDALTYATFVGGSGSDEGADISVDGSGNAWITGTTWSTDFPVSSGCFQASLAGTKDAFVVSLNNTGSALNYSTYLGGSTDDDGHGVVGTSSGEAIVIGYTSSSDFPMPASGFDTTHNGSADLFAVRLNSAGTGLVFSTFVGGSSTERAYGLAVDELENVYVVGETYSTDFPATMGAYSGTNSGSGDAFAVKLSETGTDLLYATYIGGTSYEVARAAAVDTAGELYITGDTRSMDFPTTMGAFDTSYNGGYTDSFIAKLNQTGSDLVFSSFLGGESSDSGRDITLWHERACITGTTTSTGFPTRAGSFDVTFNGSADAFVSKVSKTGDALEYSSFLGGESRDDGLGIAIDNTGDLYLTGTTSNAFPTTPMAYDVTPNGSTDAFVARMTPCLEPEIVAQSESTTACVGDGIMLSVTAINGGDVLYQWHKNGSPIPSANSSTLVLDPVAVADAGDYTCVVSNGCLETVSVPATVTVTQMIVIDWQPISQSVCAGDTVSFSVTASNAESFQWRLDGVEIAGETSAMLMLTDVSVSDIGSYTCVVSNGCGSVESAAATLDVTPLPLFSAHPSSQFRCTGGSVTFSIVETTGTATGFQWTFGGADIPGATMASYHVSDITFADAGFYACRITNSCGSVTTLPALLEVEGPPIIFSHPDNQSICSGLDATFTVVPSGPGPFTYQWRKDGIDLIGATSATLVITSANVSDEGLYTCNVLGTCGSAMTDGALLTVGGTLSATTNPSAQALGLNPPQIGVDIGCLDGSAMVTWDADPPTPMTAVGYGILLDPPPVETTVFEVSVTDSATMLTVSDTAVVLVAINSGYEDINGDGCNNQYDLWELGAEWRDLYPGDPDDDGIITVLDLMYINLSDPLDCSMP
ncbi:MAG: SBBP repeat-containing protein [Acidobacteria bacterium]|nr:SBBP repeat-containing protein [Acidobacteriota bacterium]